jgi:hypothetical protein
MQPLQGSRQSQSGPAISTVAINSSRKPVAATEDAAAQMDIMDSLGIEDELLDLDAGWRNRRPF